MVTINFEVDGRNPIMVFASDGTDSQIFNAHVEIQEYRITDYVDFHIGVFQYLLWNL